MHENEISRIIVDSTFQVHQSLGPGLLESVYQLALNHELSKRGVEVQTEVPIKAVYDGKELGEGFRADLIVAKKVIVELKSVENVLPVHKKQLLTYLKLSTLKLGLLINFSASLIKQGITRVVYNLPE